MDEYNEVVGSKLTKGGSTMTLLQHSAFNPWRDVDRFFDALANEPRWRPAFDTGETEAAYVLRVDIPGVAQKDIQVRIEEDLLTVQGERKTSATAGRFGRQERRHGKFVRRFRLADTVDTDGIEASYKDGVLELALPKREPVDNSRMVPVN